MMKKTGFLVLAAMAALQTAPRPAHAGLFSVSPEKEKKIGADASAEIEKGSPIVSGPVSDWVQRVGAKLVAASNPEFQYSFHVIDSPEINAGRLYLRLHRLAQSRENG
jgi:predicted Zn-dependent protease